VAIEPRVSGEDGYLAWCILLVEAGMCSCDECGGHLVAGRCLSCGCGHELSEADRFHGRTVAWFPIPERGRCAHADAVRVRAARERKRQARLRRTAEDLGDPRR